MGNSPLVEYTHRSPNNSGKRTHAIDRITPHCVVGQLDGPTLGDWFARTSTQASCNYAIDRDGRVCLIVDEDCRSWCSSSNANDQRAVTIECASASKSPYEFKDRVFGALADLCVDILQRHGKRKLVWIPDKDRALAYEPKAEEMLLTVHRWFSATDCPGEWMMGHMGELASRVTARCMSLFLTQVNDADAAREPERTGHQGAGLVGMSNAQVVELLGEMARADAKTSGILASLTCAQAILESGYGRSELAVQANNIFGMKAKLSGNTWPGSSWDGHSVYGKLTSEYGGGGAVYTEKADFRRYQSLEQSIADHSAYLIGAKDGDTARYIGIRGQKHFGTAATLLLAGGYATDPGYVRKLELVRDMWKLSKLDEDGEPQPAEEPAPDEPYYVRVSIPDLRIRSGPGYWYDFRRYIPVGIYTIVETKGNWGRLKSGAGWICLDYTERV